jgi:glycosyltransferase involved in cell wall biosynthesis
MKVLFDHQIFEIQKFGGVSRYFFELMNFYRKAKDVSFDLSIQYSENEYLKNLQPFGDQIQSFPEYRKKCFFGLQFRGKDRLYAFKNRFFPDADPFAVNKNITIEKLKRRDFDIFHATYYDDFFQDYIGDKPVVITVYDMIHQIFPEYFIYSHYADKTKKILENADRIIAISETTKRDLINIYGIEESKVKVIYLANSLCRPPEELAKEIIKKLPKKYLLFIGNRADYKNFYFFIQSISSLLLKDQNLYVVYTGNKFHAAEERFISKLGLTSKMVHIFASESELAVLYTNASAFVFPSLYEGFGLPVLEAFYCGCPLVCSNTGSLPEVAGDGAVYFDPKNVHAILESVELVLNNLETRERLVLNGFRQLTKFSWKKTALETLDLYNGMI